MMDKLFAVTFTPEELACVMSAIVATRALIPKHAQVPWIYEAYDSAIMKCEAIRPEAMKHASYDKAELLRIFISNINSPGLNKIEDEDYPDDK